MERTYIKDLKNEIGRDVKVCGFVETIRNQGGIKFLLIRDLSGSIQVVVLKSDKDAFNLVEKLSLESVVKIEGLVKEEKQAPGGFELQGKSITVLSDAAPELPIPVVYEKSGNETEVSKRFDYRWIDLRKDEKLKIFKIWTELEKGFREYFDKESFIQLYSPSFMEAASEGGAEVFEVKYFDRKAYLSQSPQFYKQMAMAAGFEKVFMFVPYFRAEPSFTARHMTEFTGWDFEISYIDSHQEIMDNLENVFISGFRKVKETLNPNLVIPEKPFPKYSMSEAKDLLESEGIKTQREADLRADEEIALSEIVKKKHGHDFVFIIDWPVEVRPFYHMKHEDNPKLTKSFDLLYKGLEIATGAQREHRYDVLIEQAKEKSIDTKPLEGYFNFFKYGCPPHGGVGIGPARIIMKLLDLPSVKEATFLPRDVKRLTP